MANKVGWGQGSVNNNIGWGQGAVNNSVDWGNIQANSPSGETNIVGGSTPVEQLLLDEYPNAAAAYSLRDLSTASVGNAVVRVRRSSDNVEQDFTATEITDGTLTTFTGANDGFVATWYDQSGNNLDIVQSTANNQAKLVSSGVVELENNKPAIQFNGFSSFMTVNGFGTLEERSVFSTIRAIGDGSGYENYYIFSKTLFNGGNAMQLYSSDYLSGAIINYSNNLLDIASSTGINTQQIVSSIKTSSTSSLYQNGSLSGTKTGIQSLEDFLSLGRYNSNYAYANYQEFIVYNIDQSANRTGIETNINNEYTIY